MTQTSFYQWATQNPNFHVPPATQHYYSSNISWNGNTFFKAKFSYDPGSAVRTGQKFEADVLKVLKALGWTDIELHTMGADILATSPRGVRFLFECKGGKGLSRTDTIRKTIGWAILYHVDRTTAWQSSGSWPIPVVVTSELPKTTKGKSMVNVLCGELKLFYGEVFEFTAFTKWAELV